ncbi:MAG: hypothetical protein F6J93_36195 [Oscillatoria sp. SIO1A7]|nr:hypothetical protein [Oscillatoria sp. SIO1A7]
MKIEISVLSAGEIGYKASSYSADNWDHSKFSEESKKEQERKTEEERKKEDENWPGLYIAEVEDVAEGYLYNYIDKGKKKDDKDDKTAYINKVVLTKDVNLITCLDESFKTGNIDMNALKKALCEKEIPVEDGDLLMPKLGELQYFF